MTRDDIKARDVARLLTVHPDLQLKVSRVLAAMESLGFPMCVTAAVRTVDEQRRLYAQGRTAPGRIVTNADGVVKTSNHQAKGDGFGRAVDCAFLVDGPDRDGDLETPSWDETRPWAAYGACAEAHGLAWGGRWTGLRDLPHIELRAA